jgi:hypothetical protein
MGLYHEVERLIMEDAPWITHHYYVINYLYQPYLQGVEINWFGPRATPMKKIWLKKSLAAGSKRATAGEESSR